ncbi:hypothetical protein GGTG_13795 [Gaeumannomyces tritici R3-111a-1]|uniref:Uncharacterized protein n=1 Tax=Gaeumannomyces tritici (strain R3-111a-1) TaxID=644352 RepID=J3PJV6_GAET3|nr:hypothetical protein GGTG_13795 [Gaeumannomyces tritici R3-111a-1]EJT68629.1 hypothetical protein GGTG_13795 [Gaeumannomyces tritici R3-111a-1]
MEKFPDGMADGLKRLGNALQSLPLKSLAPKAAFPGANTDAAPLRGTARFASSFALNAFLDNGLTFWAIF